MSLKKPTAAFFFVLALFTILSSTPTLSKPALFRASHVRNLQSNEDPLEENMKPWIPDGGPNDMEKPEEDSNRFEDYEAPYMPPESKYTPPKADSWNSSSLVTGIFGMNSELLSRGTGLLMVVSSIIKPNNPGPLFVLIFSKMTKYVNLVAVKYPEQIDKILKSDGFKFMQIFTDIGIPMNNDLESKFEKHELPERVPIMGPHSSYFVNNWTNLCTLGFILCLILAITLIDYALKEWQKKEVPLLNKIKTSLKWNLFFLIFFSNFDDLVIYSALEIQTLALNNLYDILSLYTCVMFAIISLAIFQCILKVSKEFIKAHDYTLGAGVSESVQTFLKKRSAYEILYAGFNFDSTSQPRFLFFYLLRIIILNLTMVCVAAYPIIQAVLLVFLCSVTLLYLLFERPFADKTNRTLVILIEVCFLLAYFALLILCLFDSTLTTDFFHHKEKVGASILIILSLISFIIKAFAIISLIKALKPTPKPKKPERKIEKATSIKFSENFSHQALYNAESLNIESPERSLVSSQQTKQPITEGPKPWKKLRIIGQIELDTESSTGAGKNKPANVVPPKNTKILNKKEEEAGRPDQSQKGNQPNKEESIIIDDNGDVVMKEKILEVKVKRSSEGKKKVKPNANAPKEKDLKQYAQFSDNEDSSLGGNPGSEDSGNLSISQRSDFNH